MRSERVLFVETVEMYLSHSLRRRDIHIKVERHASLARLFTGAEIGVSEGSNASLYSQQIDIAGRANAMFGNGTSCLRYHTALCVLIRTRMYTYRMDPMIVFHRTKRC